MQQENNKVSREGALVKNTFILSLGTVLPKLATFVTLPILTGEYMQKAEFGLYDVIMVLASLILPATTLQIQTAAFRFLCDRREESYEQKKIITNIYAFAVPVSLISLVVVFFFLWEFSYTLRLWICAYFLADILANVARQITRGLANNLDYSISAIISAIGKMVFTIIGVYFLHMGLDGAVIALFMASASSFCYLFFKTRIYRSIDLTLLSRETLKMLLHYSWPMVPNGMSMWVMKVSDRFVIQFSMLGSVGNGLYAAATKIPQLLQLAHMTFALAWQENAIIYNKDKDIAKYYSEMFKTMYNLMSGFLGGLLAIAPFLFELLIKNKDYYEAFPQVPILFLGMFFYSMSAYLGGIYVAYNATMSIGITTIVAAVINLTTDILLINQIGLYAASISTLVSYMILFLFRLFDIRRYVKMKYDYVQIILVFMIILIECWLCLQQNILALGFNFVIGISAFFVLNFPLVKVIFKKCKAMIRKLFKRKKAAGK